MPSRSVAVNVLVRHRSATGLQEEGTAPPEGQSERRLSLPTQLGPCITKSKLLLEGMPMALRCKKHQKAKGKLRERLWPRGCVTLRRPL